MAVLTIVGDQVTIEHKAEYVMLDPVAVDERRAGAVNIPVTYVNR